MDEELRKLVAKPGGKPWEIHVNLRFVDPAKGEIEFDRPEGLVRHALKPLKDLYGPDTPDVSISTEEDGPHLPLLMGIEMPILWVYRRNGRLTDGQALMSVQALAMNPEMSCANDSLAAEIQANLRLLLSLNQYSRQEVRMALRKIAKSVQRHMRESGSRGYLDFLVKYVPG
jgi:hypothetical protein